MRVSACYDNRQLSLGVKRWKTAIMKSKSVRDVADVNRDGAVVTVANLLPRSRLAFAEASVRDAEWLRLPLPGDRCPLTGLSRTTLLELGDRGLITLKRVRKPGAARGIVIINKQSLLNYLDRLEPEHAPTAPSSNTHELVPA